MTEIKLAAASRKITVVEAREGKLTLTRGGDFVLIGGDSRDSSRASRASACGRCWR